MINENNSFINLGARCVVTKRYILPFEAVRDGKYECICCNAPVLVKKGPIRRHHFCHYASSDCSHYTHPSETDIHKHAKMRIKTLLDERHEMIIIRKCTHCEEQVPYVIPVTTDSSHIKIEFTFSMENTDKSFQKCIADVAYLDNDEPICMIEICHTHLTDKERRVDPWFEVLAKNVLETPIMNGGVTLFCIRKEECENCCQEKMLTQYNTIASKKIYDMRDAELSFYIRYQLGQRIFIPIYQYQKREKKHIYIRTKPDHKRISFHEDDANNDSVFESFRDILSEEQIVIRSQKGKCYVLLTTIDDDTSYTFSSIMNNVLAINFSNFGTVEIIQRILRNINTAPIIQSFPVSTASSVSNTAYKYKPKRDYRLKPINKNIPITNRISHITNTYISHQVKYQLDNNIFTIIHPYSLNKITHEVPYPHPDIITYNNTILCNMHTFAISKWYKSSANDAILIENEWNRAILCQQNRKIKLQ